MKTVIITGATSGIGAAAAKALDNGKYNLLISGRNTERLQALSKELKHDHIAMEADVVDYDQCQALVDACKAKWGGVDVLVNNAGLGYFDPLLGGDIKQWHHMVDVNIKGVLNCLHTSLPELEKSKGQVINLGSVASHQVFPNSGVYASTKFAVHAISESIRVELMGKVRVTMISPGAVDTDFINKTTNEKLHGDMKDYFATAMRPSSIAAQIKHVIEAPEDSVINEVIIRPFR